MFLSVATLDFAGNLSSRTEPVLLRRGSGGCDALGLSSFGTLGWLLLVLALQLFRVRAARGVSRSL